MSATRAKVNVYAGDKVAGSVDLPAVFTAPIRSDIVRFVHTNVTKNARQAYGVKISAGHEYSAESWGTGRAVARIPRISGGGSHRNGQGAFGNMCRGGRMFAPNKVFRRWHRRVNKNQRRYAVTSAVAASGQTALVLARGHKIDDVPEVPLVVDDFDKISKTKDAVAVLSAVGAFEDVEKVASTKTRRHGKSKWRGRTWAMKRGPMVVFADSNKNARKAFKNLPGVTTAHVNFLNLLSLAPGGHLGRFCVWTKAAFEQLDAVYGSATTAAQLKNGYTLPKALLTNNDVSRVINDPALQAALRPKQLSLRRKVIRHNPLKNKEIMSKLNPAVKQAKDIDNQKAAKKAVKHATKKALKAIAKKGAKGEVKPGTGKKAKKSKK